jgi:hypothetical protein
MEKSPLLLKNVVHNGHTSDIFIENGIFFLKKMYDVLYYVTCRFKV